MTKKEIQNYKKNFYIEKRRFMNQTAYFYDMSIVKNNVDRLRKNMPSQMKLYYAMKANSNEKVMQYISGLKFIQGIEIASAGELERALQYYIGNDIIFTGPGKTEYELEQAIISEIRLINVESVTEAIRINNIAKNLGKNKIDVLLRINLNYSIMDGVENMSGYSTKMGIDEDIYIESYKMIDCLERVNIKGIHAFAASGVLNWHSLIEVDKYIFNFVNKIKKEIGDISVIDFGGGLGIDYTVKEQKFDTEQYGKELSKLIDEYNFQDKEIIMELGTYIVGNAGYYTAKIIDIKLIKGKKHIIIAGGINHMGLPLEMRRKHPVYVISMNEPKLYPGQPNIHKERADISGPLCLVSDKLCWDEYIEKAEVGDIVVFTQSGAYCYGEGMHEFLMHPLPEEVIV